MGLVRRKLMLGKDVTMVMFSSSPPPLCRSVAVCIATLKMGGQEGCFLITVRLILQLLLAWELHKSQAWIFGSHHRLGDMCQAEVVSEHEMALPWRPCTLILLPFLRQSLPGLGLSDIRTCLFLRTQEDPCFWNLMKGYIGQFPTEAEFHTCSSELSLNVYHFLHSLVCDRI